MSTRKGRKNAPISRKKAAPVVEEPVTPIELDTPSEIIVTPGGTRKRRVVSPETINDAFAELTEMIETEITQQRELKDKNGGLTVPGGGGIKFLRSTLKRTKQLQGDVKRVSKKKRAVRQGGNKSGFMKEVPISDEMAKFLGVEKGSIMSRVECTKGLHAYIIEHDLQNPDNRREIKPDRKLATLLKYDKRPVESDGHGPLFYYVMQKLIQQHFIKE